MKEIFGRERVFEPEYDLSCCAFITVFNDYDATIIIGQVCLGQRSSWANSM